MATAKRVAFGGKVVDLKKSGLCDMTIGELMGKKKQIAPTEIVGAFWKAIYEAQLADKIRYFGSPKEIGEELDKSELKIIKAKLTK